MKYLRSRRLRTSVEYLRHLPAALKDLRNEILSATCCGLCQRWIATWLRAERTIPCHFRATYCSRSNAIWRTCRGGSGCRFRRTLEITRVVSSCQTVRGQLQCRAGVLPPMQSLLSVRQRARRTKAFPVLLTGIDQSNPGDRKALGDTRACGSS